MNRYFLKWDISGDEREVSLRQFIAAEQEAARDVNFERSSSGFTGAGVSGRIEHIPERGTSSLPIIQEVKHA